MWNGLDVDFWNLMQPHHHTTQLHILWVKLTSYGVELSWVELATKKEKWQLSEQAWAHNNCLTRESTLLYPEVAAQIALFTSTSWLQNCQNHSKLQWVCVSTYPICLSGLHPFDLSKYIHLSTYMSYVITS
jgi:hypothetical protein